MGKELRNDKELARFQADLQSDENQRQEQVNADEWSRQFGMQEQQWQQHFAQETAWNSEQSKAARLREIGINPIAALGGSQSSPVTVANTGSPSVSPRSGVTSAPAPFSSSTPQLLNSLNEAIANYGKVGLESAEKNRISKLLSGEIKLQMQQLDNEREKGYALQLANFFERTNMPIKTQQSVANLYLTLSEKALKESQKENFDKDKWLKESQIWLNEQMHDFRSKMNPLDYAQMQILVKNLPALYASSIELNRSQSSKASAEAEGQRLENSVSAETRQDVIDTIRFNLRKIKQESKLSKEKVAQAEKTTEMLEFEKDVQVFDYVKSVVFDALERGVDISSAFAKLKSAKAFETMSDSQKRRVDDIINNNSESQIDWEKDEKGIWRQKRAVTRRRKHEDY